MKSSLSTPKIAVKSLTPITGSNKRAKSPRTLDEILHAVNLLLNLEVKFELRSPGELIVTDRRAALILPTIEELGFKVNAHPFQVYKVEGSQIAVGDKNNPKKVCYAIRSGYLEYRPQWIEIPMGSFVTYNPQHYSYYFNITGGQIGDGVSPVSPTGRLGFDGAYFALDPTVEVDSGGRNWGCYYSFYLEIDDTTPNDFPSVSVVSRRFSQNDFPGAVYPLDPFPGPTVSSTGVDVEIIPIGILQLSPCLFNGPGALIPAPYGIGILPPSGGNIGAGFISQILRDNLVNRYQLKGVTTQGDFDPSQYRTYYPGDIVFYDPPGHTTDPKYGFWKANAIGTNGAAVTEPLDNAAAQFQYWANPNPPSVTNPP